MSDTNNISPNSGNGIPEDKLMAYLEGRLPADARHEVELWLANEGMESDAMDGLQMLDAGEVKHSVHKLNHKLRSTLNNKKRKRRPLQSNAITWIAIAIILLLVVVAYIVVRKSM